MVWFEENKSNAEAVKIAPKIFVSLLLHVRHVSDYMLPTSIVSAARTLRWSSHKINDDYR